jgi:hypothetical protein
MLGAIPKFTWGAGYANTLDVQYPLFDALTYSEPTPESEWADAPSGVREAWITGRFEFLRATVRYVAPGTIVGATGWDGATGWGAFLAWAQEANIVRFYADKDVGTYVECYLVEPTSGGGSLLEDFTREVSLTLRSTTGTPFTGF